jgi:hypothetical protein
MLIGEPLVAVTFEWLLRWEFVSHILRLCYCTDVSIRQQIGLEETIIKEIEQNQLTWYGHVQSMAEGRLPKIALKWMPNKGEQDEDRRKTGWKQ